MIRKKRSVKKPALKKMMPGGASPAPKPLKGGPVLPALPGTPAWEIWWKRLQVLFLKGKVVVLTPLPKKVNLRTGAAAPLSQPVRRSLGEQVVWHNNDDHDHFINFTVLKPDVGNPKAVPANGPFVQADPIVVPKYSDSKIYTVRHDAELGKWKYEVSGAGGPGEPDIEVDP